MDEFEIDDYVKFTVTGRVLDKYTSSGNKYVFMEVNGSRSKIMRAWMLGVKVIPEPPKHGDWCWFWDAEKRNGQPGVLDKIDADGDLEYRLKGGLWWRNAEKLSDDLAEKLKEYLEVGDE